MKSAFQRIDVNGDGKLSKREMLAGDEFNQEEVARAIELEKRNKFYIFEMSSM